MKLHTWLVRTGMAAFLTVAATAGVAQAAQNDDKSQGLWMAASNANASLTGTSWGRLILRDGELTFLSNDYEWRVAVVDITRVGLSKTADRAFEIETAAGRVHYVAILDAKMMMDSPRKALQTIERAVREASAVSRTAVTARGSR